MTLKHDEERLSDMEEEQGENIHNKPDRQKHGKPQNIKDMKYTVKHCGCVGFYIGLPEILESFEEGASTGEFY